jgi:glycosyltransferase involved in cell wall biosynthesis
MKLLVVSHSCVTPVDQQFFAEVESLSGCELTIVVPSNWQSEYGTGNGVARWPELRGRLTSVPVWNPGSIPLHAYRSFWVSLLKREMPDAIYVHHEPYALVTAQVYLANRLSIKRVIGFYSAQNILKRYPPPFEQAHRTVFRWSSFAFPATSSVEEILRKKGYRGASTILPFSIDPGVYKPSQTAQQLRQRLRGSVDEVVIRYLGRIVEEKGLATLLRALSNLKEVRWGLVVVGAGPYETDFERLALELGLSQRIRRVGYISHEDAPLYLSAFDLLVLPSETRPNGSEQFGRVIIEALACGTLVIGSNSGEIPRLLQATSGGLICPEGRTDVLARQIRSLVENPRSRRESATKGQARVLAKYTNRSATDRFVLAIEDVAA